MGAGIYEKHDSRYAHVMVKHRPTGIRVLLLWRGGRGHKLTGIIGLISAPTSTVISVKREIS